MLEVAFLHAPADNLPREWWVRPTEADRRAAGLTSPARSAGAGRDEAYGVGPLSLSAHDIDAHVGQRLRERREALGISQGRLGRHLGLTFSQIQKYEKGSNRIGAGRLFQIAAFLDVPTSFFFEGVAAEGGARRPGGPAIAADADEVRVLAASFNAISDPGTRASVLALVKSLADEDKSRAHRAES